MSAVAFASIMAVLGWKYYKDDKIDTVIDKAAVHTLLE